MTDKILICVQCEKPFLFSTAEQDRFIASGFDPPKRCPGCRKKKFKVTESPNNRRSYKDKKKDRPKRNGYNEYGE
ncbi:MAG: zinc-ribbon domain containing protein [Desulfatiglandales bacterium]